MCGGPSPHSVAGHRYTRTTPSTAVVGLPAGGFLESSTRRISLPDMRGRLLDRVVAYLYYARRWRGHPRAARPPFEVPPRLSLELLMSAVYLNV